LLPRASHNPAIHTRVDVAQDVLGVIPQFRRGHIYVFVEDGNAGCPLVRRGVTSNLTASLRTTITAFRGAVTVIPVVTLGVERLGSGSPPFASRATIMALAAGAEGLPGRAAGGGRKLDGFPPDYGPRRANGPTFRPAAGQASGHEGRPRSLEGHQSPHPLPQLCHRISWRSAPWPCHAGQVPGHGHLTTTMRYLHPTEEEVQGMVEEM
jgi:hypothetical protein